MTKANQTVEWDLGAGNEGTFRGQTVEVTGELFGVVLGMWKGRLVLGWSLQCDEWVVY